MLFLLLLNVLKTLTTRVHWEENHWEHRMWNYGSDKWGSLWELRCWCHYGIAKWKGRRYASQYPCNHRATQAIATPKISIELIVMKQQDKQELKMKWGLTKCCLCLEGGVAFHKFLQSNKKRKQARVKRSCLGRICCCVRSKKEWTVYDIAKLFMLLASL